MTQKTTDEAARNASAVIADKISWLGDPADFADLISAEYEPMRECLLELYTFTKEFSGPKIDKLNRRVEKLLEGK
jgi:hypothetical protein